MQILGTRSGNLVGSHVVLMFGMGMIGSAIRDSLLNLDYQLIAEIDFNWEDSRERSRAFALIETSHLAGLPAPEGLSIVWSAGKGGFHATKAEVREENVPFIEVISFASKLKKKLYPVKFGFHYISSAGGLFEGQKLINSASTPSPLRSYGHLKLAQEQMLQESFSENELAIYRPSSVYGPMVQKTQQGLISNLVHNGRNGQVTVLDAHVMSLRDYVFSGDIGNFVAKRVKSQIINLNSRPIYFLVSARCSSIFEVVLKIERTLNLNLNIRYDESFGNHSNITFSDSVLATGWYPSPLNVGIRQFLVGKNAL